MWTRVRRWAYAAAMLSALAVVPAAVWGTFWLPPGLMGVALASLALAMMASFRAVTRSVKEVGARTLSAIERLEDRGRDQVWAELRKWRRESEEAMGLIQDVPFIVQDMRRDIERLMSDSSRFKDLSGQQWNTLLNELDSLKVSADQTYKRTFTITAALEEAPSSVAEMTRIDAGLRTANRPVPQLGGWAATVSTISLLTDRIVADEGIRHVVECGSGSSTIWAALALQASNRPGHVVAVEHEGEFARSTRDLLTAHGVDSLATVLHAPLCEQVVAGQTVSWYDPSVLQDVLPATIDLLFVDGPPQSTGKMARFPAFPILASRLRGGALVIVDDAHRDDEAKMIEEWCAVSVGDVKLSLVMRMGRAVVLQVGT